MNDVDIIMSNMYKTLLELQYPALTKASPGNLAITILCGENRVSLLSWLLSEKSEVIAETLKTLTGAALEDELLSYYSEIGICTKKELLFGSCSIQEQLPTLRLLLDFMKHVHMETFDTKLELEQSIDTILKTYIAEETSAICNLQPKLTYTDALNYFERVKEEIKNDGNVVEVPQERIENSELTKMVEKDNNNVDNELLFTEIESFLKLFSMTKVCAASNAKSEKDAPYSLEKYITGIYENFSTLKEVLHVKDELVKINVPEGAHKYVTELDNIVQNIVISCEEALNM